MKTLLAAMLCFVLFPCSLRAQEATPDRVARWNEDIDFLVKELPAKHKNAFFRYDKDEWLARAEEIRAKIPTLRDEHLVVELRALVALLGDGHTMLGVTRGAAVPPQRAYPFAAIWLSDGVFCPVLPKEHESLIGQKLVRLGELPIDRAIDRVAALRSRAKEPA